MGIIFDWDKNKDRINERKHGLSFAEAVTAFDDPLSITIDDPNHSHNEVRYVHIGRMWNGGLVVVIHAERGDTIRIISARYATQAERKAYENE